MYKLFDLRENDEVREALGFHYPTGEMWTCAPVGWREITEKEFVERTQFRSHSPEFIGYAQIRKLADGTKLPKMISPWLYFFYNQTGVGILADYWEAKVRYFAFGCDHKFKELSASEARALGVYHGGNCYHVEQCIHCNYIHSYDSSG